MSVQLVVIVALILGVIFVNGWTDAPNAIATAVSTRVLRPRTAVIMAVIMNFLGVLISMIFFAKIADEISKMVSLESFNREDSLVVLMAGMISIVIWATAAWYFGIPTSESHALIAGVTGAVLALGKLGAVNGDFWVKVIVGLLISSVIGFFTGFGFTKLIEGLFKRKKRAQTNKLFAYGQAGAAGFMAFMHGAQDGQKFIGVFIICLSTYNNKWFSSGESADLWLIVLVSAVMGLGTSVGGYKIIKAVGMDMVKLEKYQGFSADFVAAGVLLLATFLKIPMSTTHTKTTAIMGVGASRRISAVNWGVVKEMFTAWFLTFPGCGLIAFLMAKFFLAIF